MPTIYLTYAQLKAAKRVLSRGPDAINWNDWDSFKEIVATTPLDTDEDAADYAEGSAA